MRLSEHFCLDEATFSSIAARNGIDNSCTDSKILSAAMHTASCMEIVKNCMAGKVIHVDSWIRCLELNRLLKSRDTSQHLLGEAVDWICPTFGDPTRIARYLVTIIDVLNWDQLILEHTWIHLSFKSDPSIPPRKSVLSLLNDGTYSTGLTDKYGKAL